MAAATPTLHPCWSQPSPPKPTRRPTTGKTPAHSFSSPLPLFGPHAITGLCQQCHTRPQFQDSSQRHPYCGKRCADEWSRLNAVGPPAGAGGKLGPVTTPPSSGTLCESCRQRPKKVEAGQTHPFCGKSCAKAYYGRQGKRVCKIRGCHSPVYPDPSGPSLYCKKSHMLLGIEACLVCRKSRRQPQSHFCSQVCENDAVSKGPTLLKVPRDHTTFKSVADQFKVSWKHSTSAPTVRRVYKVVAQTSAISQYNSYKAAVEARGKHAAAGRPPGNENRRWHGTMRECNLGDKGQEQFCTSTSCSLCCILKTSYNLGLFGKKTGWGRFGRGIYTSATSSKSNDYVTNGSSSQLQAMLLNKVVVGKGCKMTHDNTTLTAPPAGYDSVLAEVGGNLNYDELVVYNNDAIRPSYLVLYS